MSPAVRLLLLFSPLILALIWGVSYRPAPLDVETDEEVTLDALPPLPAWARVELPDFTAYQDTNERKQAFYDFLYPRIVLANTRVLMLREHLLTLEERSGELTASDHAWLARQADRLRVAAEPGSQEMFDMLRRRLDMIPPSLVIAQAANESAWGTSRFATQGNNLFGQWCFVAGCGLVPQSRVAGASHEVARFDSPYLSVNAYITNLNRHLTYRALRNTREQARQNGGFPDGIAMAQGLIGYSERGTEYVQEIRSMIRFNNLMLFDAHFQSLLAEASPADLIALVTGPAEALLPTE
ncbi:MAG: glucosaminidase domain-containing protein [Marinobacter sp.]|nr:glucosaminidase domain-containing protein [Marinobacter sp.]